MAESPTASVSRRDELRGFTAQDAARVKGRLVASGITYTQWADEHGFNRRLVYEVLAGRRSCLRGTSHRIAVALGLKNPEEYRPVEGPDRLEGVRP